MTPRKCALAFAVFVAPVRAWVAACAAGWALPSITLPELAIDKPCGAGALAPFAQPRVPLPPPALVLTALVAVLTPVLAVAV